MMDKVGQTVENIYRDALMLEAEGVVALLHVLFLISLEQTAASLVISSKLVIALIVYIQFVCKNTKII